MAGRGSLIRFPPLFFLIRNSASIASYGKKAGKGPGVARLEVLMALGGAQQKDTGGAQ